MAPSRQLLMWSVPSIAVLLGIFWFKKKREYAKSDPGGRERIKSLKEELANALNAEAEMIKSSPISKIERSIIKSAPIDIIPNGSVSQRSSPLEMTDEEIDLEIEKIIKKKSLEKDKKMSVSSDNKTDGVCFREDCIIVKDSQYNLYSSFKTEGVNNTCDNISIQSSNEGDSKCLLNDVSIHSEKNILQSNSLKCVSAVSENGETKEKIPPDDEDLLVNNITNKDNHNDDEKVIGESNNCNEPSDDANSFPAPQSRRISERDSANHSPVDPMMASPSICHFSDSHSEGSSDSGKGCSEAASPPPTNINIVPSETGLRIHQFIIPQTLVGLLIGKYGSFVTKIKAKTGATVYVRRHPDLVKQKICAVEGTEPEIEAALEMIKEKFPEKRFPNFSTQEISAELYQRLTPLVPEFLQLVESVNNDTIMTCIVSAGHFFLQQPLHPTFPSLHALHRLMAATYQNPDVPALPRPVKGALPLHL
ncbi:unnamed protein product [Euphydryas editha]|uniref:K Homology domain-containing protein n=1 Tax=Euphydryas editha TaxID=104508 RepID=A0AAU9TLM2_EUPED|nr:unnamed protein product [Euphydryas editha]